MSCTSSSKSQEELWKHIQGARDLAVTVKNQESTLANEEASFREHLEKCYSYLSSSETKSALSRKTIDEARTALKIIEQVRPVAKPSPWLLWLSLGSVPCLLPDFKHRLRYKSQYENFKLLSTFIHFVLSLFQLAIMYRINPPTLTSLVALKWLDTATNFFLLYAYSTMILRELVLRTNGSNVRPWWIAHHVLCVLLTGTMLTWPASSSAYLASRSSVYLFSCYITAVQALQYRYQMSRLYVLRSLSRVGPLDTITESAQVHVRNNLAFLLPFLALGYVFQGYCAWMFGKFGFCGGWGNVLPKANTFRIEELHPAALSVLFTALLTGNLETTAYTIWLKVFSSPSSLDEERKAKSE